MDTKFKPGEIVQLKSGGPKMTVKDSAPTDTNVIFCQWFAGSKLEAGVFRSESLQQAPVDPGK